MCVFPFFLCMKTSHTHDHHVAEHVATDGQPICSPHSKPKSPYPAKTKVKFKVKFLQTKKYGKYGLAARLGVV